MRLVIDYTPAVRQGAGIGRHTRELVHALAPLASDAATTLVVYGRSNAPLPQPPAGMALRVVPVPNRWLTIGWHRLNLPLPVEVFAGSHDLYHASDFVLPPVRNARTLLTVHDLSFLRTPQCADAGLRAYLAKVVPSSVARADQILADSQATKRDLVDLLHTPAEKVTVVYPGVETRFHPVDDTARLHEMRVSYGIGDGPFVLGVGTLEPRKNWPALIRAWTILRQSTALPHRLVIAGGKGWLTDEIFAAIDASPAKKEILLAGFVADADLPALYSAADVFAFPSLYEGFGIPVLEALACGTPVVCANNSSLPEAAGEAAVLVDAGDDVALAAALQRLIEDDALRASLRQRGLQHAAQFSWRRSAERLWQTYQAVLRG
ncbi:MAG: glycosyltransferase family 1 protein [Caldilineales bacterium]